VSPYLEANPAATYGVVVAVLLLIFIWQPIPATGTPVGMIVFTVLALIGTEALRRQTRLEFGTGAAGPEQRPPPVSPGADDPSVTAVPGTPEAAAAPSPVSAGTAPTQREPS
jgi:hypothetical protein